MSEEGAVTEPPPAVELPLTESKTDSPPVPWESEEGRKQRAEMCAKEVRQLLTKYECILTVPTVDISTGRFIPIPQIQAAAIKQPAKE